MSECSPEQLRFPPVEGLTVRADFQGGALSSDFGAMLSRGIDQHIGLSPRLEDAATTRDIYRLARGLCGSVYRRLR